MSTSWLETVRCFRPNILIEGSPRAIESELAAVCSVFAGPTWTCWLPGPLDLPDANAELFVLRNVGTLAGEQQASLARWMERHLPIVLVSVNAGSLYSLVTSGVFSAQLYYRLNTVLIAAEGDEDRVDLPLGSALASATERSRDATDV